MMRLNQWMSYWAAGLIFTVNPLFAADKPTEQIQIPQCLASKLTKDYPVLASNKAFKIIELPSAELEQVVLLADQVRCGRFVNVTARLEGLKLSKKQAAHHLLTQQLFKKQKREPVNYQIRHETEVNEALAKIDSDKIWQNLTHLSSYQNRSATKDTGVRVAEWFKTKFEAMAKDFGREDTNVYFVKTGTYYKQPSVVTVIGKDINAPAVVVGAHMDTLDGYMPGADDDGSGSVTALEIARVLLASSTPLKHPIYIVWYAAEERGLVGSQYVVKDFKKKSIPVKAVIQFDMTGYRANKADPTLWIFQDYTDKNLNSFLAELTKTYVKVPVNYSRCGYGCSDHASWTEEDFAAAFPCETSFRDHNPYIHTASDSMDLLNLEHMTNFTKLGLAFAIELASEEK